MARTRSFSFSSDGATGEILLKDDDKIKVGTGEDLEIFYFVVFCFVFLRIRRGGRVRWGGGWGECGVCEGGGCGWGWGGGGGGG